MELRTAFWVAALGITLAVHPGTRGVAAERQKVILDTDGDADYDDFVNVMTAAVSPEIDLVGIVVTSSNSTQSARTVAKVLHLMGRDDVPVYLGDAAHSPQPSISYEAQFPRRRYGFQPELQKWANDFPFTANPRSGAEFYLAEFQKSPGAVTLIVDGPLSTLAGALERADTMGNGSECRHSIKQVFFSGGDFSTSEWNVYSDVGSAQLVFRSGIPLYQFGGEDSGKPFLRHEDREKLWEAQTPATWALQDYYRLYRAGWDPREPFVPILYDVTPLAYLVEGGRICSFEPLAVEIDSIGRLKRIQGSANLYSRTSNHGDRVIEFVENRLTSHIQPAANHLRAILVSSDSVPEDALSKVNSILEKILRKGETRQADFHAELDGLSARLAQLGKGAATAEWHADMARKFLVGEARQNPWRDPYTSIYITFYIHGSQLAEILRSHTRRVVAIGFLLSFLLLFYWRQKRSRRVADGPK